MTVLITFLTVFFLSSPEFTEYLNGCRLLFSILLIFFLRFCLVASLVHISISSFCLFSVFTSSARKFGYFT